VLAAEAMGADFAYIGTRFIATHEARAEDRYKDMIVGSEAADILYTPYFTGVNGNYLTKSVLASGLNPEELPVREKNSMTFGSNRVKAWKDVWGAGQGVGTIDEILPAAEVIARLVADYESTKRRLAA
jgi:nitronate monooxygenase